MAPAQALALALSHHVTCQANTKGRQPSNEIRRTNTGPPPRERGHPAPIPRRPQDPQDRAGRRRRVLRVHRGHRFCLAARSADRQLPCDPAGRSHGRGGARKARRGPRPIFAPALAEAGLGRAAENAGAAESLDRLLGCEGGGAALYFTAFSEMNRRGLPFGGRRKHPAFRIPDSGFRLPLSAFRLPHPAPPPPIRYQLRKP